MTIVRRLQWRNGKPKGRSEESDLKRVSAKIVIEDP